MPDLKKVLICPLDWGLGHATRCVPIINHIQEQGHKVILAGNGRSSEFLKKEFPHLECLELPDYNIKYPEKGNMIWAMIRQIPKILKNIQSEKKVVQQLVKEHEINVIISDNRFGCRNHKSTSVYITHQVMIKVPKGMHWIEPFLHHFHKRYIKKFDFCWIPDFPGKPNLSGDLSHKYYCHRNTRFIGPLSRFRKNVSSGTDKRKQIDILAIISGPEPQRSIFQDIVETKFRSMKGNFMIIAGKTESSSKKQYVEGITIYDHLDSDRLHSYISQARFVLCRSGYSSVMDMVSMNKKALLVPTPGQTEQEYLAKYLKMNNLFDFADQKTFVHQNLPKAEDLPEPKLNYTKTSLLDCAWKEIGKS